MKKGFVYILVAFMALLAVSCDPVEGTTPEFPVKEKTVLIYMVGNNNLSSDAVRNLQDLKKGFVPSDDNLLVYYHTPVQSPVLLQLRTDETGAVAQDTVYRFPQRNSATAESLKSAMLVTQTMFPANEYGLFLWSHGTGWLPQGHYSKSFGEENGVEMEIVDMVKAFPYKLSFVVFDACLMGCVEVAYQMKDSVDYVISSPAEIMSTGFPYSKVMKHLFSSPADYIAVAEEYYNYYNSMGGQSRSATISVVKTDALKDVAGAAKVVFENGDGTIEEVEIFGDYTLPECTFNAPDGQQFKCWYIKGEEKRPGESIYVDDILTVTAGWEDIPEPTYTVTFDAGEGKGKMDSVEEISGEYILPENDFKSPKQMQFKAWEIDGEEFKPVMLSK